MVGFTDELLTMVSCPLAVPVAVGLNCTVRLRDWPEFKVTGKVAPVTEKPVPEMLTELMVTAAVPVELNVSDCVIGLFRIVLPKEMVVAFTDNTAVAAVNCSETDFDVLPLVALSFTDCEVVTAATFAVNATLVDPDGTVTELGTVTDEPLLESDTLMPPEDAALDKATLHESASDPVMEVLAHENELNVGAAAAVALSCRA